MTSSVCPIRRLLVESPVNTSVTVAVVVVVVVLVVAVVEGPGLVRRWFWRCPRLYSCFHFSALPRAMTFYPSRSSADFRFTALQAAMV